MRWLRLHPAAVIIAGLCCLPLLLHGGVDMRTGVERFLLAVVLAEAGWRGVLRVVETYERINHPESDGSPVVDAELS